jgi:hypothetical protein
MKIVHRRNAGHSVPWSGVIASAFLATASSSVAFAQKATALPDIRCLIVGSRISSDPDPSRQSVGRVILMYYLGRLDEIFPNMDIEEAIIKEEASMTGGYAQSETTRCSRILIERSQLLEKIAKDLMRRQGKPAP